MDPAWKRIRSVVGEALELDAALRETFVEKALSGDSEALERARALLRAAAQASVIDPPTADPETLEMGDAAEAPDCTGMRIGQYEIKRLIGRGGMGAVYEAIQESPRRSVALKLMNTGLASRQAVRRFREEAAVLAKLRHPAIAQVYEAGVHQPPAPGAVTVPYFAMEYIPDALPITLAAEARRLGLRERVQLCVQICDAVQHGHVRGVIHRDLKPANILADPAAEGALAPKIIDFGVARVSGTSEDTLAYSAVTAPGQIVGTLRYMSPEQAAGEDTDTRSDVYALGVIMYELFTGRLPFDVKSSSVAQTLAHIQSSPPLKPSSLVKELRGDLETILLKTVEKDRGRRYQSAADLSADLSRFLNDEAILARPPSAAYALRTFARRNRVLVGGLAATVAALVLGIVGTSIGLVKATAAQRLAQTEAARSGRVADFLKDTLRSVDPTINTPIDAALAREDPWTYEWRGDTSWGFAGKPGQKATIVEMLSSASRHVDARFANDPLVRADLSLLLGESLRHQSEYNAALPLFRQARDIRVAILGDDHQLTQFARLEYGDALRVNTGDAPAIAEYDIVLEHAMRARGWLDPLTLRAARLRTGSLAGTDPARALKEAREHYQQISSAGGADSLQALSQLSHIAQLASADDAAQAVDLARRAYAGLKARTDAPWAYIDGAGNTLVRALQDYDRTHYTAADPEETPELKEAIELLGALNEGLTRRTPLLPGDTRLFAQLVFRANRSAEAVESLKRQFELAVSTNEYNSDNVIKCSAWYARALTGCGQDLERVGPMMDKAVAFDLTVTPDGTGWAFWYRTIKASALRQLGHLDDALQVLEINREIAELHGISGAWSALYYYNERVRTLLAMGRVSEARELIAPGTRAAQDLGDPRSRSSRDFAQAVRMVMEQETPRTVTK